MLVLTRRAGESLFIGEDIQVRITGIKGNQVRLAVHAPKDKTIYREEVAHLFVGDDAPSRVEGLRVAG